MPYPVRVHREVARALSRMPREMRRTIVEKLRALEEDPYTPRPGADIARLKGTRGREDLFRLRVGDYRVIYAVHEDGIYVTEIFHRGRGYVQP